MYVCIYYCIILFCSLSLPRPLCAFVTCVNRDSSCDLHQTSQLRNSLHRSCISLARVSILSMLRTAPAFSSRYDFTLAHCVKVRIAIIWLWSTICCILICLCLHSHFNFLISCDVLASAKHVRMISACASIVCVLRLCIVCVSAACCLACVWLSLVLVMTCVCTGCQGNEARRMLIVCVEKGIDGKGNRTSGRETQGRTTDKQTLSTL